MIGQVKLWPLMLKFLIYILFLSKLKILTKHLINCLNILYLSFEKKREIINLSKIVKKFEKIKIIENLDWKTLELN